MTPPAETWVLWGQHPAYAHGVPIKLLIGSLKACRAAQRTRIAQGFKPEASAILRPGVTCESVDVY